MQRAMRPRIESFMHERREAKRLMRELHELIDRQRNAQAAAAFARRTDVQGRDLDDVDLDDEDTSSLEGQDQAAMDSYLDELRVAAGLQPSGPSA